MQKIHINEVSSDLSGKNILIDVRTPGEYSKLHAQDALNVPLDRCSVQAIVERIQAAGAANADEIEHMYIICESGMRAQLACEKLNDGSDCDFIEKLRIVEGGTVAWKNAGRAVVAGKGVISVERQVHIVAGFIIALGAALSYWVNPAYVGISAFVGVGLMFAGMTGFCGMGLIIARMPWNSNACGSCSR